MTISDKIRIYELSRDLNLDNKDILDAAQKLSISVKSHSSSISADDAKKIKTLINKKNSDKKILSINKPSIKKDMWIKRAKEYEKNINSGDPVLIAEVVRDLHKKEDSLEQQSYSERQIYLTALNRLSNEYAAVQNLEKKMAKNKLEELLNQ